MTEQAEELTRGDALARVAVLEAELAQKSLLIREMDLMFGRMLLGMRAAVIEEEHGKGAEAAMVWIVNGLVGPGELPPEEEKDAQAYFDREVKAIDEGMKQIMDERRALGATPAPVERVEQESEDLDSRLRDAGMTGVADLLKGTPLDAFIKHAGVNDLGSLLQWAEMRRAECLRAMARYDLGEKPEGGDLYEWTVAHCAAFTELHVNLRAAIATTQPTAPAPDVAGLVQFAVRSWHEQVANRPLGNVHRRTLDSVWRQVIRFAGEDDVVLIGPRHNDMLDESGNPLPQYAAHQQREGE